MSMTDGWVKHRPCLGTGLAPPDDWGDPCDDCVDGLVPPDWMTEAAAEAMFEKVVPMLGIENRIHVKDIWRLAARAALVAAARKEKEQS